jgi:MFS-type transporter involved in bile tolerance (Atg22 family)
MLYSILSLTVTSIFGGILIGLIQEGEEKAGLRYIPLLLLFSLSIFFLARFFVTRVFTSITVG